MTDLTKAIAELQRISVSKTEHLLAPHDEPFATILNAALSGDLIPRADADLALALMVEKAADSLSECSVWCDSQERTDASWHNGVIDARKHHMATIRSLVHASAFSDLQALRVERDKWFGLALDNKHRAEAAEAKLVEWQASQHYAYIGRDGKPVLARDMEARAEAAEAELTTLRAQVERLTGALRFYADFHENPNDGPWGINSQDFGKEARAALTEGAAP